MRELERELERARRAMVNFSVAETGADIRVYGNGHINDTFLVEKKVSPKEEMGNQAGETGTEKYILQRINHSIFKNPIELMENILMLTSHLKEKIGMEGGDPDRETLNVILSREGKPLYQDEDGDFYRMYRFIERAISLDEVGKPEDFYESALAFGRFQRMLADFPAESLYETIPGFHDTEARFSRFCQVVKEDKMGRAAQMKPEIDFVLEREKLAGELGRMQRSGLLPLRVTHNDTKLNNVLMDQETGKAVCVVDLDTVMPGLAVNDFGDSIRFGASTGAEDEPDLTKIECSMELFEIYTRGFIEGCSGRLTQEELKALPLGAAVMTFECGMRFLADYLEGDVYFKIHREGHNRDRCRTQFKLVRDMEDKWEEMNRIVEKYR